MNYDEAKAEVYDKLVPRVGQFFINDRSMIYSVDEVHPAERKVILVERNSHTPERCSMTYLKFWCWCLGLPKEPIRWWT